MSGVFWEKCIPSSSSNTTYRVQYKNGVYSCTCPGFIYQNRPFRDRVCKHISSVTGKKATKRGKSSIYAKDFKKPMSFKVLEENEEPPVGWYASLKADGFYVRIVGRKVYTKSGRLLEGVPEQLTKQFSPKFVYEGEVFPTNIEMKKQLRRELISDALHGGLWDKRLTIIAHDVIMPGVPYKERLDVLSKLPAVSVVPHIITSKEFFHQMCGQIESQKQEGLVLRDPNGMYEHGKRTNNTLKWKPWKTKKVSIPNKHLPKTTKSGVTYTVVDGQYKYRVHVPKSKLTKKKKCMKIKYNGENEDGSPDLVRFVEYC